MRQITLKDYFNSVGFKISDAAEYLWGCYGKNAFSLDAERRKRNKFLFSTGIVFDTKNSKIYQMESWDYKKKIIYRWVNPRYYKKFLLENKKRGINPFKDEEGYTITHVSATKILTETKIAMID